MHDNLELSDGLIVLAMSKCMPHMFAMRILEDRARDLAMFKYPQP